MEESQNQKPRRGRKIRAYIALSVIVIAVVVAGLLWYREYTKFYSTDDAYIDADRVSVSAKMMGRITHIYASEGDTVKPGMLLVELDSTGGLCHQCDPAGYLHRTAYPVNRE